MESQTISDASRISDGSAGYLEDSFVEIIRVTRDYYVYKIFDSANNQAG